MTKLTLRTGLIVINFILNGILLFINYRSSEKLSMMEDQLKKQIQIQDDKYIDLLNDRRKSGKISQSTYDYLVQDLNNEREARELK